MTALTPQPQPESTEIGFARSLLAYELPDGRLKLIDGHLRAALDPDQEVEVEVLDVNDAEARKLLLSIDPLALLAQYEAQTLSELRALAEPDSPAVRQIWEAVEAASNSVQQDAARMGHEKRPETAAEQWLVLLECDSEAQQVALLQRFQAEGLRCKALLG